MPLFFISPRNIDEKNKAIVISGKEARHITKSLRHRENEEILLSDGIEKKYVAKIKNIENELIECSIIYTIEDSKNDLPVKIILAQAILKKNKMEWVIQKATELGISEIIPFTSSRTIPLIQEKREDKKMERWQKIAIEASKQSERIRVPRIHTIIHYNELLKETEKHDFSLIFWEDEKHNTIKKVLNKKQKTNKIIYIIGPEGGFSLEEISLAKNRDISLVSLGKYVVRSETAAIFALSIFNYHYSPDK